jgi:2-keto-myo-inositol isomerase
MHDSTCSRRALIAGSAAIGAGALLPASSSAQVAKSAKPGFTYCLNTSTIRRLDDKGKHQPLPIEDSIAIASAAGYSGIEPWIREISSYVDKGGSLSDLRKRIADAGLSVESAIGFAKWIVDDDEQRKAGLEAAKRDMELVAQIGGTHIAAPPVGATKTPGLDLLKAAERYRALLEVGEEVGVIPMVEVWGFSANLHRLGQSVFVAIESGHPKACLLPDFYHIYKGGSDFAGLRMLGKDAIPVFHMNDYPDIPRAEIGDQDRVYPGDGVCKIGPILRDLAANGCFPALSLELFNRDYWSQDPAQVAKTGIAKMRAAVEAAFA